MCGYTGALGVMPLIQKAACYNLIHVADAANQRQAHDIHALDWFGAEHKILRLREASRIRAKIDRIGTRKLLCGLFLMS